MPNHHSPFFDAAYSTLGWVLRSSAAVGSERFHECVSRAEFYVSSASERASTPGERAVVSGLAVMIEDLLASDHQSRVLLADSVSGMNALESWAFVEMCEAAAADDEPV